MASRSTELVPISGRVDRHGRLVAADAALERLQVEAGSRLGRAVALPQLAALARAAASLGVPLSRTVIAADSHHDIDLFVRAEPVSGAGEDANEVHLTIERWVARPMAAPRLALVDSVDNHDHRAEREALEFETDAALNMIDVSPALASLLGVDASAVPGRPLTSLFRLIEQADGALPLLGALATQTALEGQRAVPRNGGVELTIDADPSFDEQGRFAGFHARLRRASDSEALAERGQPAFEESLDEALRSPLARIISAADHIVERGDGPLRSDYATYASDIAAAGRHLLSVIRSMGQSGKAAAQRIDLAMLASEAVGLVQPTADPRSRLDRNRAACRAMPRRWRGARGGPGADQYSWQRRAPFARRRDGGGGVRSGCARKPGDDLPTKGRGSTASTSNASSNAMSASAPRPMAAGLGLPSHADWRARWGATSGSKARPGRARALP